MSCHIIWYHNISYDITTYHMISPNAVAIYHITALRHSMHVMIKDVLRLSGIVILILNISNLGKDAKKKNFKNWFDTSQSPLGFFQDFRSLVLQKIGHSLANRQAKAQPLWPHPSKLPSEKLNRIPVLCWLLLPNEINSEATVKTSGGSFGVDQAT